MKVLIVDDEEDTRSIASMSLGLLGGHQVIEACNGKEGLEKAIAEKPDVILLDLLMPDMNGAETLSCLRKNPTTLSIPVIFITVKDMYSEFGDLKQLGALAVLAKPFDPTMLSNQISEILSSRSTKAQGIK